MATSNNSSNSSIQQVLANLTPSERSMLVAMRDSGMRTPQATLQAIKTAQLGVVEHGERYFYIPETAEPIKYEYFQKIILKIIDGTHSYPTLLPFYSTVEYSTVKKSGKTALSGAYARYRAESKTMQDEILFFANDEGQSRGRGYEAIVKSIVLSPLYDPQKRVLTDEHGNVVWRIIEDYLEHIPTLTKVKAVNVDYRGEAGSNPTLTVWTECWGYDTQKQMLLFDEMTPVLTRERSQRYLEGYAGYTGKSIVQEKVESLLTDPDKGARQLTLDDIPDWPWQDEEILPLFVNDSAGMFGYLDRGQNARRRMPWLLGERGEAYYKEQAMTLHDPQQFDRLHNNMWISPTTAFLPIEWWRSCATNEIEDIPPWREPTGIKEIPDLYETDDQGVRLISKYLDPTNWRETGAAVPVVLACDASVTSDCTALVGMTRNPNKHADCVLRFAFKWVPPGHGSKMDYEYTQCEATGLSLKQQILDMCMRYNVVELAYDNWQLHHMMMELMHDAVVWTREFKQASERDVSDKQLYDLIVHKRIAYDPNTTLVCHKDIEKHILGASRTVKAKENTKFHIVKANDDSKIDLLVAMSMASAECLRLDV